jgi:hypothetical protein
LIAEWGTLLSEAAKANQTKADKPIDYVTDD